MRQIIFIGLPAALVLLSGPAIAASPTSKPSVSVSTGKQLYDSAGHRLGAIYRVTAEGNPQLILNGKLVTIPASTVSDANGKLTTSLTKAELERTA